LVGAKKPPSRLTHTGDPHRVWRTERSNSICWRFGTKSSAQHSRGRKKAAGGIHRHHGASQTESATVAWSVEQQEVEAAPVAAAREDVEEAPAVAAATGRKRRHTMW